MDRSRRGSATRKLLFLLLLPAPAPFDRECTGSSRPPLLKLTVTGRESMGRKGSLSATVAGGGLAALKKEALALKALEPLLLPRAAAAKAPSPCRLCSILLPTLAPSGTEET